MAWSPKTERCAFLVDNLDLPEAAQVEDARWEYFQIAHLEDDSTFRIENKARQIAWSWLVAAEAVADGILTGASTTFQSINLSEAQEKIRYGRNVINALPRSMRPKLVTDNKQELEFANGARIISLPGNPQRGKAQMNLVFDEWAHIRQDRAVYVAALPSATKGNGRIRGGSSPMGAGGLFWEIFTQSLRQYPGYTRKATPWWEVRAFCRNVREARRLAPHMATLDRVEMFGNDRIKAIYANLPEVDFQQEYEATFVDETAAWITWDEIRALQAAHNGPCLLVQVTGTQGIDRALNAITELRETPGVEMVLAAGVDIGRTKNTTELYIGGISTLETYPLRLAITMDNCEFDDQEAVLTAALERLPIKKMLIDQGGLGRNLAENAEKAFPAKVEGYNFTLQSKALLATDAKMYAQQRRAPIPADRDMAYQFHSIKRTVTPSKNFVFDTAANEQHHADKFWAWALMLAAAQSGGVLPAGSTADMDMDIYKTGRRGRLHGSRR